MTVLILQGRIPGQLAGRPGQDEFCIHNVKRYCRRKTVQKAAKKAESRLYNTPFAGKRLPRNILPLISALMCDCQPCGLFMYHTCLMAENDWRYWFCWCLKCYPGSVEYPSDITVKRRGLSLRHHSLAHLECVFSIRSAGEILCFIQIILSFHPLCSKELAELKGARFTNPSIQEGIRT